MILFTRMLITCSIIIIIIFLCFNSSIYGINHVPSGIIIPYYGLKAPHGWSICNGRNHTPDLRGKFIFGGLHKFNRNVPKFNIPIGVSSISTHSKQIGFEFSDKELYDINHYNLNIDDGECSKYVYDKYGFNKFDNEYIQNDITNMYIDENSSIQDNENNWHNSLCDPYIGHAIPYRINKMRNDEKNLIYDVNSNIYKKYIYIDYMIDFDDTELSSVEFPIWDKQGQRIITRNMYNRIVNNPGICSSTCRGNLYLKQDIDNYILNHNNSQKLHTNDNPFEEINCISNKDTINKCELFPFAPPPTPLLGLGDCEGGDAAEWASMFGGGDEAVIAGAVAACEEARKRREREREQNKCKFLGPPKDMLDCETISTLMTKYRDDINMYKFLTNGVNGDKLMVENIPENKGKCYVSDKKHILLKEKEFDRDESYGIVGNAIELNLPVVNENESESCSFKMKHVDTLDFEGDVCSNSCPSSYTNKCAENCSYVGKYQNVPPFYALIYIIKK